MKLILVLIALVVHPALGQSPAPAIQELVFKAISQVEGCVKWKNPGCLTYARQPGATRGPGGYAVFASLRAGREALRVRIAKCAGQTVLQFLREYNPGIATYPARLAEVAKINLTDVL